MHAGKLICFQLDFSARDDVVFVNWIPPSMSRERAHAHENNSFKFSEPAVCILLDREKLERKKTWKNQIIVIITMYNQSREKFDSREKITLIKTRLYKKGVREKSVCLPYYNLCKMLIYSVTI